MINSTTDLHSQHMEIPAPPQNKMYNAYDLEEETRRSSFHYELPPEFFYTLTGGEWNCYSCSLWEPGLDMTAAQEKKLDKQAEMMELKPGMRILEVGCGWGGPLVYLCHKYGVTGKGITITPIQIAEARARAEQYGVQAEFELLHWKNLPETEEYDAIYTDEVLVHFHDLGEFFGKCYKQLKPGRVMVHKELHLSHSHYGDLGPLSRHVNRVYGYTGNYIPLHKELTLLDENGFLLKSIYEMPIEQYRTTMDAWLKNTFDHRTRLKGLVGEQVYTDFRAYLKAIRYLFTRTEIFGLHMVASRKPAQSQGSISA